MDKTVLEFARMGIGSKGMLGITKSQWNSMSKNELRNFFHLRKTQGYHNFPDFRSWYKHIDKANGFYFVEEEMKDKPANCFVRSDGSCVPVGVTYTEKEACEMALCVPKKMEKNMRTGFDANVNIGVVQGSPSEDTQRSHLQNRLWHIAHAKQREMYTHFKLGEDDRPTSPEEMIERIKKGEFSLKEPDSYDKKGKPIYYDRPTHYFEWRKEPKDEEGYNTAMKTMNEAKTKVEDRIVVLPPVEGLKALEEFEAATFH
jgi:hypothetical protein